jgi:hypothetical protein
VGDVEHHAVHFQRAGSHTGGHGGVGQQVLDLGVDVLADHELQQSVLGEIGMGGAGHRQHPLGVVEPRLDRTEGLDFLGVHHGLHRAAIRVAADDHLLDPEDANGVLDRRRHTAHHVSPGWDDIAGVPNDEQISRLSLQQLVGHHARVRAADVQRVRLLVRRKLPVQLLVAGVDLVLEMHDAAEQLLHCPHLVSAERVTRGAPRCALPWSAQLDTPRPRRGRAFGCPVYATEGGARPGGGAPGGEAPDSGGGGRPTATAAPGSGGVPTVWGLVTPTVCGASEAPERLVVPGCRPMTKLEDAGSGSVSSCLWRTASGESNRQDPDRVRRTTRSRSLMPAPGRDDTLSVPAMARHSAHTMLKR